MKLFRIALFAAGVFSESSAKLLRGVSSDRDLQSRILGGNEANTGEYPDAVSLSMQSFNVNILAAYESPVSIPIEDLALMIFAMITTNNCNGDEISIVEVASALLEGLPNRIIPDAKVSATETKGGAPEDQSRQEDLIDLIVPAIGCLVSPEALAEVIIPLIRDFVLSQLVQVNVGGFAQCHEEWQNLLHRVSTIWHTSPLSKKLMKTYSTMHTLNFKSGCKTLSRSMQK